MMKDKPEKCAICGSSDNVSVRLPPAEWEIHLIENRGLEPPINHVEIPVCEEHYAKIDMTKDLPLDHDVIQGMLESIDINLLLEVDGFGNTRTYAEKRRGNN